MIDQLSFANLQDLNTRKISSNLVISIKQNKFERASRDTHSLDILHIEYHRRKFPHMNVVYANEDEHERMPIVTITLL